MDLPIPTPSGNFIFSSAPETLTKEIDSLNYTLITYSQNDPGDFSGGVRIDIQHSLLGYEDVQGTSGGDNQFWFGKHGWLFEVTGELATIDNLKTNSICDQTKFHFHLILLPEQNDKNLANDLLLCGLSYYSLPSLSQAAYVISQPSSGSKIGSLPKSKDPLAGTIFLFVLPSNVYTLPGPRLNHHLHKHTIFTLIPPSPPLLLPTKASVATVWLAPLPPKQVSDNNHRSYSCRT